MGKKIFALKVPSKLKRTMEFISKESGHPLSKIYYRDIEDSTNLYLGIVLMHNLDISNITEKTDIRELKNLSHMSEYFTKKNITPIKKFISIMDSAENQNRFKSIFPGIKMAQVFFSYENIGVKDLCKYLGSRYFAMNKNISSLEFDALRDFFFDKMLKAYFDVMAVGTLSQLEREWERGQGKLELLKRELMREFDETFKSLIVEPIVVEEVEDDVEGPKTKRKRTTVPYSIYKSQDSSKRPTKRRKVRAKTGE